ncbi:MAG: flagellar export protein FliJ [Alphaproteobacteria bacterium]|nr:flagellar export protein FliJ [Alphaproteobacteria bacterium]
MAGLDKLIGVTSRKGDGALANWQRLKQQCDEALKKLSLLKQHRERYRDLLNSGLGQGMPAVSTMTYLGFIGQIEEVVLRQESEVGRLEQACTRQWQQLVEFRREKRMYEIVQERAAEQELAAALRQSQAELDELLQRVGKLP